VEIVFGFIVMGCTWLAISMLVKLVEFLFDKQAQMTEWMHDRDGITLAKVIWFPLWAALSLFVMGVTLAGAYAIYSLTKDVVRDFTSRPRERR
jgi:hypothetical protein